MIRVCRWAAGLKPNRWREWWVREVGRGKHAGGVGPVGRALNAEPSWGTVNTVKVGRSSVQGRGKAPRWEEHRDRGLR